MSQVTFGPKQIKPDQFQTSDLLPVDPSDAMQPMLSISTTHKEQPSTIRLYIISWLCFFIMGTFNNFINVVIVSSAKSLSDSLNEPRLIGLITWSLTSISLFTKLLNTLYLQHTTHKIRVLFIVICNWGGIIGLSISLHSTSNVLRHYLFVLLYLVILGGTCSFAENVIVGFLKMFPPKLAGAWSSGTGFAGLFGSFFYLLCSSILSIDDKDIYLLITPSMIFYLLAFIIIHNSKIKNTTNDSDNKLLINDVHKESLYNKLLRCYKLCMFRAWMMTFVYLFEYIICVGFASISNTNLSKTIQDNIYVYLSVCYQIGVFVSRSSVSIFSTNKFGILAILQFINVLLWHIQCYTLIFSEYIGIWFEYVLMIYVGLLGGLVYVNVIHDILCDGRILSKDDRELCLNIVLVHIVFGMLGSSVYTVVMDNTFFKTIDG